MCRYRIKNRESVQHWGIISSVGKPRALQFKKLMLALVFARITQGELDSGTQSRRRLATLGFFVPEVGSSHSCSDSESEVPRMCEM